MAFWTRLRPGRTPGINPYCCDFHSRCYSLRWRRKSTVLLNMPDPPPDPPMLQLARQAVRYVARNDIFDQPLPF